MAAEEQAAVTGTQDGGDATRDAGEGFNPNDYITPELTAAFDKVFGAKGDGTDGTNGEAAQPNKQAATSRRRASATSEEDEAQDVELAPADDGSEPNADDEPVIKAPKAPAAPNKQPAQRQTPNQEATATLDPVLKHAARRAGWDDASIEELYAEKPELAEQTFGRFLRSYNDLSAQFAQLGQRGQPQGQQQVQQQQQVQSQQQQRQPGTGANPLEAIFGADKWANITKNYGNEFVADVLEPLQAAVIAPMQKIQAFYAQQVQQAQVAEMNTFFSSVCKDGYEDLYGPNEKDKRSKGQETARFELATTADAIRSGFAGQGIDLSVSEALERAFMYANSERFQQNARQQVTNSVKTRARQITARPNQRGTATSRGPAPKSIAAAEAAYEAKLQELGIED